MNTIGLKIRRTATPFLLVALGLVYVPGGQAHTRFGGVTAQALVARLTTRGSGVMVNDRPASSGASLLTGATIETPATATATIDLGSVGSVDLEHSTAIQLDFDDSGNVRVKLMQGCTTAAKTSRSRAGRIETYTAEGASEVIQSRPSRRRYCRQADGTLKAS